MGDILASYLVCIRFLLLGFAGRHDVPLHVRLLPLQALLIHILQQTDAELYIGQQKLAFAPRKVLPHHDAQHLEVIGFWRHSVRRDDPAPAAQCPRQRELVKLPVWILSKAESHEGKTLAVGLRHDDKTLLLQLGGEVISSTGEITHDGLVATPTKADELIVLPDYLGRPFGEIEGDGRLISAEVVDIEDQLLGQVFRRPPDDPTYARIDEAILTQQ